VAESVTLCLFEGDEEHRLRLPGRTGDVFHGHVGGIGPGARYGFRVDGPWDPATGRRCNPAKLLVDPYARLHRGAFGSGRLLLGHTPRNQSHIDTRDSASETARSVVVDDSFDWAGDRPLRTPLADSIIYETHVKGITRRHPAVPESLRGTYAGLAHPAVIEHLQAVGVTPGSR
jgi:glycogen operon protein